MNIWKICRLFPVLGAVMLVFVPRAHAHGGAGDREFPATLTVDDPAVKDEASLPTVQFFRNGAGESVANHETDFNFEVDKTITERLGIGIEGGYSLLDQIGDKRLVGAQNLSTTLKYQFLVDGKNEAIASVGVVREWGGTGAGAVGSSPYGSTTPTFYYGKGMGDLPIGVFRPLAVTGTLGFQIPDAPNSDPHQVMTGMTVQYSIPYLQEQVMDFGGPDFIGHLIPLIEFNYATPLTHTDAFASIGTIAPGVIYTEEAWQMGVEALLPGTSATHTGPGVIAQFHVFLGEIFPRTFGRPVF